MVTKQFARNLAQMTFEAMPVVYDSTMAAGLKMLQKKPMRYPGQVDRTKGKPFWRRVFEALVLTPEERRKSA